MIDGSELSPSSMRTVFLLSSGIQSPTNCAKAGTYKKNSNNNRFKKVFPHDLLHHKR